MGGERGRRGRRWKVLRTKRKIAAMLHEGLFWKRKGGTSWFAKVVVTIGDLFVKGVPQEGKPFFKRILIARGGGKKIIEVG